MELIRKDEEKFRSARKISFSGKRPLVRSNKCIKFDSKCIPTNPSLCYVDLFQHVNAMVWQRLVNSTSDSFGEQARVDDALTVVITQVARTVKDAARIITVKQRRKSARRVTVIILVPKVSSVTKTAGVTANPG